MTWISRRNLNALRNSRETYADAYKQARRDEEAAVANVARLSRAVTQLRALLAEAHGTAERKPHPDSRLGRALTACAGYRHELADQRRLIRNQQQQLDSLLGLDNPDIAAGANWQQRRHDKRKEYTA